MHVWNRTPERARELAGDLGATAVVRADPADLLVNCTSVGLDPSEDAFKALPVDADDVTSYECVVDLVYRDTETPLVQAARARRVRLVGEVAYGNIGGASRLDFTAIGPAVNVAARLEMLARPQQTLATKEVALACAAVSFRSLGEHALRGKAQPVEVFEVVT